MNTKTGPGKGHGLPKFDTTGWLSVGIVFSAILFGDSLWSLLSAWRQAFFPFQFGKLLGIGVGLGLAIHCVDMIFYHRKNRTTASRKPIK